MTLFFKLFYSNDHTVSDKMINMRKVIRKQEDW
jgi:hypothetical protein